MMVIINESTVVSSKITDASDYQEFKILNFLKLDIHKKYNSLKEVYNITYSIHIADYQSISYTFNTILPEFYKNHSDNCDCKSKELCLIIVPIPRYKTIETELVPEKCLIKKYKTFSLISPKYGKRNNTIRKKIDEKD